MGFVASTWTLPFDDWMKCDNVGKPSVDRGKVVEYTRWWMENDLELMLRDSGIVQPSNHLHETTIISIPFRLAAVFQRNPEITRFILTLCLWSPQRAPLSLGETGLVHLSPIPWRSSVQFEKQCTDGCLGQWLEPCVVLNARGERTKIFEVWSN